VRRLRPARLQRVLVRDLATGSAHRDDAHDRTSRGHPERPPTDVAHRRGWNFRTLGVPIDVPPIDATLRALIRIPSGGRYLHTTSNGQTHLRVDGRDIDTDVLVSAGPHRVEVDWNAPLDSNTYFRLEWGPAPDATEPVPREAIRPGDGPLPPMRRALWIAALALALITFFVVRRIVRTSDAVRERTVHAALVVALVCTGIGFRMIDYDVTPDWRDNDDERFACWNGYFLLTEGRPRALTIWPAEYSGLCDITVHRTSGACSISSRRTSSIHRSCTCSWVARG